jgi:hypothetical protein
MALVAAVRTLDALTPAQHELLQGGGHDTGAAAKRDEFLPQDPYGRFDRP